jgi:hypothetical protein
MNVQELFSLSSWYSIYYSKLEGLFSSINSILQNNATQSVLSPLEEPLKNITLYLRDINFGLLSLQQIKVLEELGVRNLLGEEGANLVETTIKTVNYDPVTSQKKIQNFIEKLQSASSRLAAYNSAVTSLGIKPDIFEEVENHIIIRVGFQNRASIENVTDWKDSAKDWWEIIRGLAMAAGESPEDTKVVGATNGSLILVLAGTGAVTMLLARISKHIAMIAKDVISVRTDLENLRQKTFFTKVMEREFANAETKLREDGIKVINAELKRELGKDVSGDVITALERSVEKLLTHSENGGNVDFVSPPLEDELDDDQIKKDAEPNGGPRAELEAARKTIDEYQQVREAVRLLTKL